MNQNCMQGGPIFFNGTYYSTLYVIDFHTRDTLHCTFDCTIHYCTYYIILRTTVRYNTLYVLQYIIHTWYHSTSYVLVYYSTLYVPKNTVRTRFCFLAYLNIR